MTSNPRPVYCCGKCPPIEGGGYDRTCLFVKECPMYNTIYGAWTRFGTSLLQPFVDIYERFNMWNWKRKKRKQ